jgi:hypothetical protein
MSRVQLYAVNPQGQTVLLQLSEDSPVKMSLSVAEINPFTPSSFFSQTFRLPGIGPNTQFFQDVYSVNGSTFNPAAAAQAWILSDGTLFSLGNLNLQAVVTNDLSGNIEYDVYFLGDTSNLSTQIGEDGMSTIDASELNHTLSYANVTSSGAATGGATAGLKNGDVLYPLCEWGYTYSDATKQPEQNTLSTNFAQSFTLGATSALLMEQMKPAIRVKWLFDKILADADYTYTSTFLESDYFQSLYFVSDSIVRPFFPAPSGICQITANEFSIFTAQTASIPWDNAIVNSDQAFNTALGKWTAPATGTYTFTASGICTLDPEFPSPPAAFKILVLQNSVEIYNSGILTTTNVAFRSWSWSSGSLSLTQGNNIEVKIQQMAFGNAFAIFSNSEFNCLTGPNQVVMSSFLPDETILKKIDFVRSLVRMFNLVFEPSRVVQKTFVIEPWINWVQSGGIKDWTRLYDGSADLQASPVFAEQQRILKFGAQEDGDWLNKQYQDQNKADYWYRQFDSGIKLIRDEQPIDVQFGANPLQSIPAGATQYPDWVFPTLGRFQPGKQDQPNSAQVQPIVPIPRLYHYNGLQSNPVPWYLYDQTSGSGTGQAQNSYPLISPYSSWPPDLFSTINLNFLSKPQPWSADSTLIGATSQDLYTVYWSEYVDWLYDPYNRKVALTLRIDPYDVVELAFNDRIWIKDTWYFIQKIADYVIGQTALVKVDLVKVPGIAIPGPIPLAATGGTEGTTCRVISLCNNNTASPTGQATYTYVDCENNVQSVTLPDSSCAAPLCMLFPLINALPSGFTASNNGACGTTGAALTLHIVNDVVSVLVSSPITTVEVQGASGGTGGTYTTIQNFTFDGSTAQDFFAQVDNVPTGFGLKVLLSSSYAPGTALVSQEISLATNGTTGASASRLGTYQPISAIFPATIVNSDTYTAYINITY